MNGELRPVDDRAGHLEYVHFVASMVISLTFAEIGPTASERPIEAGPNAAF
jgi:hypothetical protein